MPISTAKRIVAKSIRRAIEVEAATWSAGGRLDWWVKERREWWGRVRCPDGRQRWIRLLIFVPQAAQSHDFVVVIGRSWMAVAYLLGQYVVSQLVGGVGRKLSHDAQGANGLVTPLMGRRRGQKHLANEPMPHHHPVQFRESCRQSGVAMRRMILSVFGGLLAAALLISPAHAVKPVIVDQETIRFDGTPILDPDLSEACDFPVTVSTTGHIRVTEFRDKAGNTRLVTSHPSLSETLTSPYATIQTSDRGLDKFTETPDGTLLIFGTGIHLRVKGQVYAIGLWRLTVDLQTDELIDQEYHGRFDVLAPEILETICSLLGPQSQ